MNGKARIQDIFGKWVIGIVIFYFFPYLMKYGFAVNESIVSTIGKTYMGEDSAAVGNYIGGLSDLRHDQLEERSPEYVKRSTYVLELGSEDATLAYINRLESYMDKGDLMRVMRSMAGITARFIYVVIWYIMFFQLLVFIVIYFKRYLMIAFLIAIFPITLFEYVIATVKGGKQSGLSQWCKEFFTNVFLQTIHAITYGVISGVCIRQIRNALESGDDTMNWFLMICAINFVFSGEKILKGIMNAGNAQSVIDGGEVFRKVRKGGGMKKVTGKASAIMHSMRHGK